MREANDRGYDCLLVEDCCTAAEHRFHVAAVEMVKGEGGVFGAVGTAQDLIDAVSR